MSSSKPKASLAILQDDVIGNEMVWVVTEDGERYMLEGVQRCSVDFEPGEMTTANLTMLVEKANILTRHSPTVMK